MISGFVNIKKKDEETMRKTLLKKIIVLTSFSFLFLAMVTLLAKAAVVAPVDRYGFGVALFKDRDPWNYPANEIILQRYGIPYDVYNSTDMGNVDLSKYTKVCLLYTSPSPRD